MHGVKRIHSLSLRKKILLLAVGAEVLIMAAAAMLGLNVLNTNRDLLSQAMDSSLRNSAELVSKALDNAEALSEQLYSNAELQRQLAIVRDDQASPERQVAYHKLYDILLAAYQQYPAKHIHHISLITDSFTVTAGGEVSNRPTQEAMDALYQKALNAGGKLSVSTEWADSYGLLLCRGVRRIQPFTLETLGVLVLCLDMDRIVKDATTFHNEYDQSFYLLDDENGSFYQSEELSAAGALPAIRAMDGRYGVIALEGHHYFAQRGTVPDYGWEYVCMVSYDRQWNTLRNTLWLFLGILLATLLVAMALSGAIAHSISRDFTSLVEKMRSFRGQNLPAPQETAMDGTTEVAVLHRHFDQMANEITQLIQERYQNELLNKEAQIKALEAQINPHFLYNVLDSINWRARAAGLTDVSAIVDAFGKYLRVSLNRERKLISVKEELSLVDCYITIQQYRFEDHLRYLCRVPPELMEVEIPKLVIQPLVENAVKYAVETSIDDFCQIVVDARLEGERLFIEVKNSGSLMEEKLLSRLRTGELKAHGFGIGLTNIDERMRLTFGEEMGLRLFNENGYAVCRLTLPYRPKQNEPLKGGNDYAASADCG
ncbi:MAG: histidine kinase [Eubacteriales bacterium]|nr:histidine kinase [Eubacteriales bacterium]